jgi:hypothetical protein
MSAEGWFWADNVGMQGPWRWIVGGLAVAAGGYAGLVARGWQTYGRARLPAPGEEDPRLDRFMPEYEVVERHHVRVRAPAEITLAAAVDADIQASPVARAIFSTRELVLGSKGDAAARPKGLLAETTALGWVVLAEIPGREIVLGAVTRPWQGNVVFRGVPAEDYLAFREPEYVKIVWNLRADDLGHDTSMFRSETRVMTTDAAARAKFRWYWARFSPGIVMIRRMMLPGVKAEAERRAARLHVARI